MKHFAVIAIAAAVLAFPVPANPAEAPVPEDIPIALLVDLSSGQVLYSREPNRRFVPASVTKVMTAYTAFKLVDEGALRLDMPFLYSAELEDEWYAEGSNMFLRAGERPTIAQLLLGITTVSGNDASVAMAIAATGSKEEWLELMNANARDLGMSNTHFGSPNGFPDGGQTYSTAQDLAILGRAITQQHPDLYARFFGHRGMRWRDITQANHDPVTGRVEGADGLKTGFTNEAGFTFLGSAERDGRRLVMVLAGSPTGPMRDDAARSLLRWGFDEFRPVRLLERDRYTATARVQNGSETHVDLKLPQDFMVAIPKDADVTSWKVDLVYRGPIEAPIATGERLARLRLTINGETVLETPLEAMNDVPRANALQRVVNAITGWVA